MSQDDVTKYEPLRQKSRFDWVDRTAARMGSLELVYGHQGTIDAARRPSHIEKPAAGENRGRFEYRSIINSHEAQGGKAPDEEAKVA